MITLTTIFTPMAGVYSFMAIQSTASVCLIPVIKCESHFQLSNHGALNVFNWMAHAFLKYNCLNTEEQ